MPNEEIALFWKKLSAVIAEEISSNPKFSDKLEVIFREIEPINKPKSRKRTPVTIDPFILLEQGEDVLHAELHKLEIGELKAIISTNSMDTSRRTGRWKDRDKLEEYIVETTKRISSRGKAFWSSGIESDEMDNSLD
jgi:hypothetical protein